MAAAPTRTPPSETRLLPPPWTAALIAARWYVRYGPGMRPKRALLREWLEVGLQQNPRRSRIVRTRHGVHMRVSTTKDFITRSIYSTGSWEPCVSAFIASRLRPGDGFIDVGSNVGYYALLASRFVGRQGAVVAIEPMPDIHKELLANLALNHVENIRVVRAAVTSEPGEVTLYVPHTGNLGATTMVQPNRHEAKFVVPGLPLAQVVTATELRRARIIKIDVEGAEGVVLASLAPMLDQLRPECEIVVEISPERLAATGNSADRLLAPFTEYGLHPYKLVNPYVPEFFPELIRRPAKPTRITDAIETQTDIVLSRIDADTLA